METRRDRGINGGDPRLRGEAAVYAAKARLVSIDGEHGVIRWHSRGKPPPLLFFSSSLLLFFSLTSLCFRQVEASRSILGLSLPTANPPEFDPVRLR
jgi:hypothetical protein